MVSKIKSENRARFCINERGLWLMVALVRKNELFRIQLFKTILHLVKIN